MTPNPPTTHQAAIVVERVSKVFRKGDKDDGVMAISDVSLDVRPGEFVCLIGPSGCGKTSLLRLVGGIGTATSGEIKVIGEGGKAPKALIVWQEFALLDWRTVRGNVEFGLELDGQRNKREREELARQYVDMVGLSAFCDQYPNQISGGMKQRVGLARALALQPEILLMDEPFGALDAQTRMVMQEEILHIWEQTRTTIVFVTHSLEEAILLSDRIVVLTARPGRVKEILKVNLSRPRSAEIRADPAFGAMYERLYFLLKEEVDAAMAEEMSSRSVGK